MSDADEFYRDWHSRMSHAKSAAPDVGRAFGGMYQALMKEGALSIREKELISLAISMALRCEPCIYVHAEKALKVGATREQIMEMAGVVVTMQGGPGYTYVPKLVEALDAVEERSRG
jgi:AhpD family alkylhydroperoxidase